MELKPTKQTRKSMKFRNVNSQLINVHFLLKGVNKGVFYHDLELSLDLARIYNTNIGF